MHQSVMEWGKRIIEEQGLADKSVLEVGSANVNGSLRSLFHADYIGVDLRPGPGVDKLANGNDLPFPDDGFGVVVCTEVLSHDPHYWLTVREMRRVLKPGGVLLLTLRGPGFGRNDSPCDYYRFTNEAVALLLFEAGYKHRITSDDPQYSGVLAWARK